MTPPARRPPSDRPVWIPPPGYRSELLATGARQADRTGICALCRGVIREGGDRIATLADGGGDAHLACIRGNALTRSQ